jgi:phytoene/squalene synthetase
VKKSATHFEPTLESSWNPFDPSFSPETYSLGKSHFQITFLFIWSKARRQALRDLYAFCRIADDISDAKGIPREKRQDLLHELQAWVKKRQPIGHRFWDRFLTERTAYEIPDRVLLGIIDGVAMDITKERVEFNTWEELDRYIYGVASCVGEAVLAILGAQSSQSPTYADAMGKCLQYLNIMRDIEEDEAENRIYIPQIYLQTLTNDRLPPIHCLPDIRNELFSRAMNFRKKAKPYSLKCLPAELMAALYLKASQKFWRHGNPRRLSKLEKVWISLRTAFRFLLNARKFQQHPI